MTSAYVRPLSGTRANPRSPGRTEPSLIALKSKGPQGAWGAIAHDLKLRQEILKLRGRKRLTSALSHDFLQRFIEQKFAKAKRTRRAASDLQQTLQTLAAAPTGDMVMPAGTSALPAPAVDSAPTATLQRIEPQRLSIGTGFAGAII